MTKGLQGRLVVVFSTVVHSVSGGCFCFTLLTAACDEDKLQLPHCTDRIR